MENQHVETKESGKEGPSEKSKCATEGSLRSSPKAPWQCEVEPWPHGPDLELIADMAWSRKKIKDLSRQLEEVENDHEAVAIEEEILVQARRPSWRH